VFHQLICQNAHSTQQIVVRLENRLSRIMRRQVLVGLPIKIAAVSPRIFVCQLKEPLGPDHAMADAIHHGYLWIRMLNVCRSLQPRFGSGQRLEKVCPEGSAVWFADAAVPGAELRNFVTHFWRDQFIRQRLLDRGIPLWLPRVVIAQEGLLFCDRCGGSWLQYGCWHYRNFNASWLSRCGIAAKRYQS